MKVFFYNIIHIFLPNFDIHEHNAWYIMHRNMYIYLENTAVFSLNPLRNIISHLSLIKIGARKFQLHFTSSSSREKVLKLLFLILK